MSKIDTETRIAERTHRSPLLVEVGSRHGFLSRAVENVDSSVNQANWRILKAYQDEEARLAGNLLHVESLQFTQPAPQTPEPVTQTPSTPVLETTAEPAVNLALAHEQPTVISGSFMRRLIDQPESDLSTDQPAHDPTAFLANAYSQVETARTSEVVNSGPTPASALVNEHPRLVSPTTAAGKSVLDNMMYSIGTIPLEEKMARMGWKQLDRSADFEGAQDVPA